MVVIVILEPPCNQSEDGSGVGQRCDVHVVPLERVHEGLGYSVALRAHHRRVAGFQTEQADAVTGPTRGIVRNSITRLSSFE